MMGAAPFLFFHTPASHPVGETICTIERVRRWRWCCRHDWWQSHWWGCRGASEVVNSAAPILLTFVPTTLRIYRAIVWVYRSVRYCCPRSRGQRRGGSRRWRWWHGGEWRWRLRRCSLGESRGWHSCRTPFCLGQAAVVGLVLGPHRWKSLVAIEGQSRRESAQQPAEQWDQQQQTQETTGRDEAGEIPSGAHDVKVATCSDVLVCGLLDVLATTRSHV